MLQPQAVSEALAKEVSYDLIASPFPEPPILRKKYGMWHIIMDLSSSHNSTVNDRTFKEDYT